MAKTKLVRVNLSALLRKEWTCVAEVPEDYDESDLQELAGKFYDEIDGGEFWDDEHYWEKGDCHCEALHTEEGEKPEYRVARSSGRIRKITIPRRVRREREKRTREVEDEIEQRVEDAIRAAGHKSQMVMYAANPYGDDDVPTNNLDEVCFQGDCFIVYEKDYGVPYISSLLHNPTFLEAAVCANSALHASGDEDKSFFEGVRKSKKKMFCGVKAADHDAEFVELCFGS